MIVYLAGEAYGKEVFPHFNYNFNRLDSYIYIRKKKQYIEDIHKYKRYILDSGAFTFMNKSASKTSVDWVQYVKDYGRFIREHSVENFFELDIEMIVGMEKMEELRTILEDTAGHASIPVWHIARGQDYWQMMIKKYSYVAIGGFVSREIKKKHYRGIVKMINQAAEHNCRVHGLGVTGMQNVAHLPFYSIDSSSWTAGNRYKTVMSFHQGKIVTNNKLAKKRISNHLALAKRNFGEWVKFSDYAEDHL